MVLSEKLLSLEEFEVVVGLPENALRRLELQEGMVLDVGPSSKLNTVVTARIIYYLNAYVIANQLGLVTAADAGFQVGPGTYRQPDAAFIRRERMPSLDGTYFTMAPDIAVEVVSPGEDIFRKAKEYLHAGSTLVWAVYAKEQVVNVFSALPGGRYQVDEYTVDQTLDGGAALPGFVLAVRELFIW